MGNSAGVTSPRKIAYKTVSVQKNNRNQSTKTEATESCSTHSQGYSLRVSIAENEEVDYLFDKCATNFDSLSFFSCQDQCSKNAELRDAFYRYILDCEWFEDISRQQISLYNDELKGLISFNQYCLSMRGSTDVGDDSGFQFNKMEIIKQLKINESKDLESFRLRTTIPTCFTHKEINFMVCASLWPYFLESAAYKGVIDSGLLSTPTTVCNILSLENMSGGVSCAKEDREGDCNTLPPTSDVCESLSWPASPLAFASPRGGVVTSTGLAIQLIDSTACVTQNNSANASLRSSMTSQQGLSNNNCSSAASSPAKLLTRREKRVTDIYFQAADDPSNQSVLADLLEHGSWADDLVSTLDNHKYSICISAARPDIRGFPIVYVNKAFETLTQYSREEVLGRRCDLLQSAHTEPEQVRVISEALRRSMACKVALVNARKDGSEFLNLLAMQPVLSMHGAVTHVVSVQYDVTRAGASIKEIKLVDDLLRMIANILK